MIVPKPGEIRKAGRFMQPDAAVSLGRSMINIANSNGLRLTPWVNLAEGSLEQDVSVASSTSIDRVILNGEDLEGYLFAKHKFITAADIAFQGASYVVSASVLFGPAQRGDWHKDANNSLTAIVNIGAKAREIEKCSYITKQLRKCTFSTPPSLIARTNRARVTTGAGEGVLINNRTSAAHRLPHRSLCSESSTEPVLRFFASDVNGCE